MIYDIKVSPYDWKIKPTTEIEEVLQNVMAIILTTKGSVPLDREFGINGNLLDAPINSQSKLTTELAEAIKKYEPRARLQGITFGGNMADGELKPTVRIEIVERNLRGGV